MKKKTSLKLMHINFTVLANPEIKTRIFRFLKLCEVLVNKIVKFTRVELRENYKAVFTQAIFVKFDFKSQLVNYCGLLLQFYIDFTTGDPSS